MPFLTFTLPDGSEQRRELKGDLLVGRDSANDVVVDDKDVSRQQCRFFLGEDKQVWVEDMKSFNGTFIDGERIGKPSPVTAEAKVVIGRTAIRVQAGKRATSKVKAPERHGTREVAASERPKSPLTKSTARPNSALFATLRGMAKPFAHIVVELDRPKFGVGRAPPADVAVDDDSISRKHAELVKVGTAFTVKDLSSANGTFVNDRKVTEERLTSGDVVRFGLVELAFHDPVEEASRVVQQRKLKLFVAITVGLVVVLFGLLLALGSC